MTHEEIRQLLLETYEDEIEQIALRVAAEFWPELDAATVVEKITPKIRQKLFDAMKPEDKLFFQPTAGEGQVS